MLRHTVPRAIRKCSALSSALAASVLAALLVAPAAAVALPEVGQGAPEFSFSGSDGETYTLASILASGKEGVVLAWFPKAFTPG